MSSIYTVSKEEIIKEALELCGVLGANEDLSSEDLSSVGRTLNMLIKAWQVDGIHIWAVDNVEIPLIEDKKEYTVGPDKDVDKPYRPIQVLHGIHRSEFDYDTPINLWSREEYWRLSDKNSKGVTLNLYHDRRTDHSVFYVWPVPETNDRKLILQIQRGLEFPIEEEDNVDFPSEYMAALSYNLAAMIAPKFGLPTTDRNYITQWAQMLKQDAEDYNRENEASMFIEPDRYSRGYGNVY